MGPVFGDGGHDLYISTNANTANSCSQLGHTYRSLNPYPDRTSLAGSHPFKLLEYEVYQVIRM